MAKKVSRRGVVVCGAYGLGNTGDDAVLAAIIAALRRIDNEIPITVLARRPGETARRFGVSAIHPLRPLRWLFSMRRAELFLSGGGSLLQDVTSRRSLLYYLLVIALAKRMGCAVQLYGCGAGPLRRAGSRRETAKTLNRFADAVTVRDAESAELLTSIGVTEPRILLAADPALALDDPGGVRERCFGVILRSWPGFEPCISDVARTVRYVYETYRLDPVFFCLGLGDRAAADSVIAEMEDLPASVSIDARRVGRMSLVLSMRLHGLVFALRGGAPAVGIEYDPKVAAFCRDTQYPCVPLSKLTADSLRAGIDEAVHLDAERISADAARLRQRERVNAETAAALLAGEGRL